MTNRVMDVHEVEGLGITASGGRARKKEAMTAGLDALEKDGWKLVTTGTTAITKELLLFFHKD